MHGKVAFSEVWSSIFSDGELSKHANYTARSRKEISGIRRSYLQSFLEPAMSGFYNSTQYHAIVLKVRQFETSCFLCDKWREEKVNTFYFLLASKEKSSNVNFDALESPRGGRRQDKSLWTFSKLIFHSNTFSLCAPRTSFSKWQMANFSAKTLIYHFCLLPVSSSRVNFQLFFFFMNRKNCFRVNLNSAPFRTQKRVEKFLQHLKHRSGSVEGRQAKLSCFKEQFHFNFAFDYSTEIIRRSKINPKNNSHALECIQIRPKI